MHEGVEQLRTAARARVESEARNAPLPDAVFTIISYNDFYWRFGPLPQPLPSADIFRDRRRPKEAALLLFGNGVGRSKQIRRDWEIQSFCRLEIEQ
jgi:hypothetical protein